MSIKNPSSGASDTADDARRAFRLRRDVRYRIIDSEALVLRQDEAEILGLNEVGSRILELLAGRAPVAEVLARLESEYDVERQRLEDDVAEFLAELVENRVLEEEPPELSPSPPGRNA